MRFARRTTTTPTVEDRPTRLWSPAQLVALVLGGSAIAFGVLALIQTGLDLSHLTRAHDTFLGFGHTPLLGLAEIGFGVLMVLAAIGPGVVVLADWWSAKMTHWLGVSDRNGWLFIAVGGVALFAAFFAPVWTTGGPRVVRKPVVADTPTSDTTTARPAADEATRDAPAPPPRRRLLPWGRRHDPVRDEPARITETANR